MILLGYRCFGHQAKCVPLFSHCCVPGSLDAGYTADLLAAKVSDLQHAMKDWAAAMLDALPGVHINGSEQWVSGLPPPADQARSQAATRMMLSHLMYTLLAVTVWDEANAGLSDDSSPADLLDCLLPAPLEPMLQACKVVPFGMAVNGSSSHASEHALKQQVLATYRDRCRATLQAWERTAQPAPVEGQEPSGNTLSPASVLRRGATVLDASIRSALDNAQLSVLTVCQEIAVHTHRTNNPCGAQMAWRYSPVSETNAELRSQQLQEGGSSARLQELTTHLLGAAVRLRLAVGAVHPGLTISVDGWPLECCWPHNATLHEAVGEDLTFVGRMPHHGPRYVFACLAPGVCFAGDGSRGVRLTEGRSASLMKQTVRCMS
jgi:hypothetical protein